MPGKNKLGKFWNEKARTQLFSAIVVALLTLTAVTGFFVALPKQASAYENTLPFTVDYNNSIDDKIIKSYSEGGCAISLYDQGLTNTVTVYDDINDCFYIFYFTPSDQSSSAHVCVKKYWISNNTFSPEFQFPISGSDWQHSFPVGQSWVTPADVYDAHIRLTTWLDEYNHIYVMYGGHATSTYPITVFRSTVPISQLQYTNISQWERTGNVTGITGSAYLTALHIKSGYYKGYTILYYRQGAQGGSDYFAWSNDNGTTWTTRLFSNDATYGKRGWFYDDIQDKWIFLYVPFAQDWANKFHFCWATIDDIINGTGMRSSSQTITDTPAYSFPLTSSSIPSGVDNWAASMEGNGIAYNSSNARVYISYIDGDTGSIYLIHKELGSLANWTKIEIDTADAGGFIGDMSFVYNESILMMSTAEVNGTEWEWKVRWSNNPLDNSTWHKYNATATTVPTNSCLHAYWPNIQVYADHNGDITGEVIYIQSIFKRVASPVASGGATIEEGVFTYIDLREEGNSPPTCSITSPSEGATVNGTVSITGTASDTDGTIQSVEVKIDSGTWQTATGTTSWSYSWDTTGMSDGSHTIYARSYDGTDYSTEDSVTVTVDNTAPNQPPTAAFTYSINNLTVTFTDGSTDSDGTIASWNWSFGDGQYSTTRNPQHTYSSYGTYSVNLTVTDNDGATNTVSESITLATGGGDTVSSDINTWYLIIGIMAFAIVAMMMVVFAGKRR